MNLSELVSPARISKGLWWQRALALVGGCSPVSEGCENCWAAAQAHMRSHQKNPAMRKRYAGLTDSDGKWNGSIRLLEHNLGLPLKVKKPTLWSVWNDLFHPAVPDTFIEEVMSMMIGINRHFYLCLTKRPERMMKFFQKFALPEPVMNLGLGVTVELPKYLHRVETLINIPAALRFVSLEPLLGELSISSFLTIPAREIMLDDPLARTLLRSGLESGNADCRRAIDWVQIGCESGRKRRPMEGEWASDIIKECVRADVPVFLKQKEVEGRMVHAPTIFNGNQILQFPEVEWTP